MPTKPSALLSKLNRNASITAASLSGTDARPTGGRCPSETVLPYPQILLQSLKNTFWSPDEPEGTNAAS